MDDGSQRHTCGECHNVRTDKFLVRRVICKEGYGFRRFDDRVCLAFKGSSSGEDSSVEHQAQASG